MRVSLSEAFSVWMVLLLVVSAVASPVGVADLATAENAVANDEWATYQFGPARTGYDPSATPPAKTERKEWEAVQNDEVASSPAVVNGTVYIGSDTKGRLYARNATDGSHEWIFEAGYPVQSPTVSDGIVYAGTDESGEAFALNATDGSLLWNRSVGNYVESAPAVVNGTVYFVSWNTSIGGDVWALDAKTGEKRWQYSIGGYAQNAPAVVNGTVFVSADGTVHALDAETGNARWERQLTSGDTGGLAVSNGTVFVANGTDVDALNTQNGDTQWSYDMNTKIVGSPAVARGTVYVTVSDVGSQAIYEIDAETGNATVWPRSRDLRTGPVVAEKTLFVGTEFGLLAIDTTTGYDRYFYEVSHYEAPYVESAPAVGTNAVYFGLYRTNDSVYRVSGEDYDYDPTAKMDTPSSPVAGNTVTLSGTDSYDVDGPIETYQWDVDDDGTFEKTGETVEHTFDTAGEKPITLRVTDESGATNETVQTVTVLQPANLSVTNYAVSDDNVTIGETITVEATVENTGDVEGSLDVSLYENATELEWKSATVAAHSRRNVSFSTSFFEAGDRSLTVESRPTTEITVRDETPPTAPETVSGPEWASETADISWLEATDNGAIDHYEVQVDAGSWKNASGTSTRLTGLANGTHDVSVRAVDTGGNVGPVNDTTIRVDAIDPSAPTVSASDGWHDDTVPVSWGNVTDDESGFDYYELRTDGGKWASSVDITSYEFTFSKSGNHTVSVRGVDVAGNRGPMTNETVRVDRSSPNVSIELSSTSDSETATLTVNLTDGRSGLSPENVNLTVDDETVTNFSVVNDSVVYTGTLGEGYHSVSLTATDDIGNTVFALKTFEVEGSDGGDSGGSGGGGGGSSAVPPPSVSVEVVEETANHVRAKMTNARADAPGSVSLGLESDRVTFDELQVTPESDDAEPRFFIDATLTSSPDVAALPSDEVLGYLRVTQTYIQNRELASVTLQFHVPTDVASPDEMTLYRYHGGEWQALETEFVGERDGRYDFRATASGVSLFGVGVTHSSDGTTATATATTTTRQTTASGTDQTTGMQTTGMQTTTDGSESVPGFGPLVALAALAVAVLAARQRE